MVAAITPNWDTMVLHPPNPCHVKMHHRLWKPEPLARPDYGSLQPLTSHSHMTAGNSTIVENDPANYFSSHIIAKVGDSPTYWPGSAAVSTSLLDMRNPGLYPRSDQLFLSL